MSKFDTPPAFPTWLQDESMAPGMTLRDYFAAQAMAALFMKYTLTI